MSDNLAPKLPDLVVGITGASGAIYARRLLQVLVNSGRRVHLTISPSGAEVLAHELGLSIDLTDFDPQRLLDNDANERACETIGVQASGDRQIIPRLQAPTTHGAKWSITTTRIFERGSPADRFRLAAWWSARARWERWPASPAGNRRT